MLARETGLCLRLLRLLADADRRRVPVSALATDLDISRPHAAKLVRRLGTLRLIDSRPGVNGGISLSPRALSATYYSVAAALNDPALASRCALGGRACNLESPCPLHIPWSQMHAAFVRGLRQASFGPMAQAP